MDKNQLIEYYTNISNQNIPQGVIGVTLNRLIVENPNMTYGGIAYTLWYIKTHKELPIESIWIVPYYYNEAQSYYENNLRLKNEIAKWNIDEEIELKKQWKGEDVFI